MPESHLKGNKIVIGGRERRELGGRVYEKSNGRVRIMGEVRQKRVPENE